MIEFLLPLLVQDPLRNARSRSATMYARDALESSILQVRPSAESESSGAVHKIRNTVPHDKCCSPEWIDSHRLP